MKFVVWTKEKLSSLSAVEKEQWFDVLNYGLEEDNEVSFDDPDISAKQDAIKADYLYYLNNCARTNDYICYFVLYDNNIIVSVARIVSKGIPLYLEGLETHRDFRRKGYATILIQKVFSYCFDNDIEVIKSVVALDNHSSNVFHLKMGFELYNNNESRNYYKYTIMGKPRHLPYFHRMYITPLLYGMPFHKDNNKRYYKESIWKLKGDYHFLLFIFNVINILLSLSKNFKITFMSILLLNLLIFCMIIVSSLFRLFKHKNLLYRSNTIKLIIMYFYTTLVAISLTALILKIIQTI